MAICVTKNIVAVNFTFAVPGGMWLKDDTGTIDWVSADNIIKMFGEEKYNNWMKIAYHDGYTGMWRKVD